MVASMLAIVPLLLQAGSQPRTPQRDVADPGVIATGQRVTPAGVQTVFIGRVSGVRFGASSAEVWAAVPGAASTWRDRRQWRRGPARPAAASHPAAAGERFARRPGCR